MFSVSVFIRLILASELSLAEIICANLVTSSFLETSDFSSREFENSSISCFKRFPISICASFREVLIMPLKRAYCELLVCSITSVIEFFISFLMLSIFSIKCACNFSSFDCEASSIKVSRAEIFSVKRISNSSKTEMNDC